MKVHSIYASTSGNVEFTIEFIAKVLRNSGFNVFLSRSEKTSIDTIKSHNRFIFATSTWEHGRLNPFFEKLYEAMQNEKFYGKQAAFVGLGDHRYEPVFFCKGIKDLRKLWLDNGGIEVNPTLMIQGEPYEQLDSTIASWSYKLTKIWQDER